MIPYDDRSRTLRLEYNRVITSLCEDLNISVVDTKMGRKGYVDAVHFNAHGCRELAGRFADAILSVTEGEAVGSRQQSIDATP